MAKILTWALGNKTAISIAAIAVFLTLAGWKLYSWGGQACEIKWGQAVQKSLLEQQAQFEADLKKANEKSAQLEQTNQTLNKTNTDINRRLQNEISKTIYHSCVLPPAGVLLYDNARKAYQGTATGQHGR